MSAAEWEQLETACKGCTACGLSATRHNVVFGVGNPEAEVLFIEMKLKRSLQYILLE